MTQKRDFGKNPKAIKKEARFAVKRGHLPLFSMMDGTPTNLLPVTHLWLTWHFKGFICNKNPMFLVLSLRDEVPATLNSLLTFITFSYYINLQLTSVLLKWWIIKLFPHWVHQWYNYPLSNRDHACPRVKPLLVQSSMFRKAEGVNVGLQKYKKRMLTIEPEVENWVEGGMKCSLT